MSNSIYIREPSITRNIGLWYYRTFFSEYHELDPNIKADDKKLSKWLYENCKPILDADLTHYSDATDSLNNLSFIQDPDNLMLNRSTFQLRTIYPGLVCGIGYEHEIGFKNEFKLGFSFDYTTGLPYLPGSTVKGTLRSAFKHKGYPEYIIKEWINRFDSDDQREWPWELENGFSKNQLIYKLHEIIDHIDWNRLEDHVFEGSSYFSKDQLNNYQIDVFFDAFISETFNDNGLFLGDDYITCHQNKENPALSPFTDPNPVRFLKVRSDVEFTFGFRLSDVAIGDGINFDKEIKKELFKQILLDLGIGAKTNVGYGQFEK